MNAVRHINPYRETVKDYLQARWRGALPLPYRQKNPPPTGFTGHRADYPTLDKIEEWCEDGKRHNICMRLAKVDDNHEIIGIDVDHYLSGSKNKKGGDQLADLENKHGPLPDTWTATSRVDGISGIRFFRVPRGLAYRGQIAKDIECISKGYRFAVVWPSIHPSGEVYWWFPPGVKPTEKGRESWDGTLPDARTLPELPESWLLYITQGRMEADVDQRIDMDASVTEVYEWADDTFYGDSDTPMCACMESKVEDHKSKIRDEATSHDKIINAHSNIIYLSEEGHLGWNEAFNEVEVFYAEETIRRDKRSQDEVYHEVWRSRTNGLRKAKARVEERIKIGAAGIQR